MQKLTFYVHHPKNHKDIRIWPIEGDENECARISVDDGKFSYSLSLDSEGRPYVSVFNMKNGELDREISNFEIFTDFAEELE
jgi:hypothetical protein